MRRGKSFLLFCYTIRMKSGFVVVAGRSNVGKSSLINSLVGNKIAIVTPKPQTTRGIVRGIVNDHRGQIVFVDTPGLFLGRRDRMSQRMNQTAQENLEGVDAVLYVMDPTREPGAEEEQMRGMLRKLPTPIVAAVNKIDLPEEKRPFTQEMLEIDVGQRRTLPISAKTHFDLNLLLDTLYELMPEGEAYYPQHQLTDLDHKTWLAETIREKAFLALDKELPYSIAVTIEEVEVEHEHETIDAILWTTDERYKKMIIGAKGQMIKAIGSEARKEIMEATGRTVRLNLEVKVDPKWQERLS